MSIFQTLFGGSSQPAAQPAPGNANQQPGNTPGTQQNGVVPPQGQNQGDPANSGNQNNNQNSNQNNNNGGEKTPLDQFAEIWKTDPNSSDSNNQAIFAGLDPAKVMESAKKVDFAKAVSPQQLEAIQKGGTEAVTAFAQAMNSVAQTVYAQNAIATTKIVEQALSKAQEQYDAKIPSMVKKLSANEGLLTENPLLSNPAIQPLVGALTEQLTRKNPNATAAEIRTQVNDYFSALGTSFAPKPAEDKNSSKSKSEVDWSAFLE